MDCPCLLPYEGAAVIAAPRDRPGLDRIDRDDRDDRE
jgi:hypothetical protein